jgi:hypothetical protein
VVSYEWMLSVPSRMMDPTSHDEFLYFIIL